MHQRQIKITKKNLSSTFFRSIKQSLCHGESFPHSISKYPNPLGYTINNYWVIVEAENNEIGWYSMMSKKAQVIVANGGNDSYP